MRMNRPPERIPGGGWEAASVTGAVRGPVEVAIAWSDGVGG